jgi:hypothetical protein
LNTQLEPALVSMPVHILGTPPPIIPNNASIQQSKPTNAISAAVTNPIISRDLSEPITNTNHQVMTDSPLPQGWEHAYGKNKTYINLH